MFFGHLPDHLVLFPTTALIDANGAFRKMLPFQNGQLEVWTAKSQRAQQKDGADIYVLRFYGNADRADRWSGRGALALFDETKRKGGGRPIVLFGASIGATAALHVAAQRSETKLILHNPTPVLQLALRHLGGCP